MTESADQIVRETVGSDITTALARLSAIAAELGADRASSEARDLAARVAEGPAVALVYRRETPSHRGRQMVCRVGTVLLRR